MPIIRLTHPADALDADAKATLARRLTEVLLTMEGGAATVGGRGFATVIFDPVAAGDWWVGGMADDSFVAAPGRFLAHVTIPEGYMNREHKNEVHRLVTDAIVSVAGTNHTGAEMTATSIQIIIDEVTEGDWGAGGRAISLAHIADVVGLPKDGERYVWVQDYFAAKARQFAAAGYPSDCGGLLDQP